MLKRCVVSALQMCVRSPPVRQDDAHASRSRGGHPCARRIPAGSRSCPCYRLPRGGHLAQWPICPIFCMVEACSTLESYPSRATDLRRGCGVGVEAGSNYRSSLCGGRDSDFRGGNRSSPRLGQFELGGSVRPALRLLAVESEDEGTTADQRVEAYGGGFDVPGTATLPRSLIEGSTQTSVESAAHPTDHRFHYLRCSDLRGIGHGFGRGDA